MKKSYLYIGGAVVVAGTAGMLIYRSSKNKQAAAAAASGNPAPSKYSPEHNPNSADATPLYNNNILKFWNWFDTVWACSDWITWHKSLKTKYGKAQADTTFLQSWEDLATGSSAIDCRSFNESFRNYMSSEKLLDSLYSGIGNVARPLGVGTDVVSSVGSSVTSIGKTIDSIATVLKVAIPIALVVTIGFGGWWAYKHFIKNGNAAPVPAK